MARGNDEGMTMATKQKPKNPKATQDPAAATRKDGWQNLVTGLGTNRDKRTHTMFGGTPVWESGQFLDALYAGDDMIARIVDLPAQEMTREWLDLHVGDEPEAAKAMLQRLEDLDLQAKTDEALTWARLHGGALMVLGIDDGQTTDKPLKEDSIRSFGWVSVVDRWEVRVASRYADVRSPKYGRPEVYEITPASEGGGAAVSDRMLVHESRVIRFDGVKTPRRRMALNGGWCDSVVTRVYEVIRDFCSGYAGAAATLADFSVGVVAIQNLAEMLAADQEGLVLKRLEMLDMARSIARAVFMDAEKERFEYVTRSIAGMPETLDRLALRLSAGTGIPVTLLMGQSPAGLNATGASDIRLWYDNVRSQQNQHLTPRVGRVVRLAFLAKDGPTKGKEPEDWSISWRPLWQPTEKEQAETRFLAMQTDVGYIDRGVLSPRKVAESRFGGDRWSMETTIDPEDWDVFGEPEPTNGDGDAEGIGG